MHKIGGAHLQYVNNRYAKFEYKRMNTIGVSDYTNKAPPKHLGRKKCLSSTPVKNGKNINGQKMGDIHLQYVNNHYTKFEYKVMNTVGITDYTN